MNEITIGDKIYISSKRAAEITGYAKDYVGQLCREGHIDAKMVGRGWYVYEPSIRAHRFGEAEPVQKPVVAEKAADAENSEVNTGSDWNPATYTAEAPQTIPVVAPATYKEPLAPAEETLTDMQAAWKEWFDRKQEAFTAPEIESPEVIDVRNGDREEDEELLPAGDEEIQAAESAYDADEADTEPLAPATSSTYGYYEPVEQAEVKVPLHKIEDLIEHIEKSEEPDDLGLEPVAIHAIRSSEMAPQPQRGGVYVHDVISEHNEPQGRIVSERVLPMQKKGSAALTKRSAPSKGSNAIIVALLIAVILVTLGVTAIGSGVADQYLKTSVVGNNAIIDFLVGTRQYSR